MKCEEQILEATLYNSLSAINKQIDIILILYYIIDAIIWQIWRQDKFIWPKKKS